MNPSSDNAQISRFLNSSVAAGSICGCRISFSVPRFDWRDVAVVVNCLRGCALADRCAPEHREDARAAQVFDVVSVIRRGVTLVCRDCGVRLGSGRRSVFRCP